jgi:hypothetical protein
LKETPRYLFRQGFWACPSRNLVVLVRARHVHTLMSCPRAFGFTGADEIRACYLKYIEKPGTEKRARGELIRRVVEGGWIRIRRYPRMGYYTVNCPDFSETVTGFLGRLFRDLAHGVPVTPVRQVLVESDPDFRIRVDIPGLEESWFTIADLAVLADPDSPPLQWVEERILFSVW